MFRRQRILLSLLVALLLVPVVPRKAHAAEPITSLTWAVIGIAYMTGALWLWIWSDGRERREDTSWF